MAWIESHQSLARHPKTLRLMRRLGTSRSETIGHLHMFWWWCLDYAPDGELTQFDNEEIAIAAEWEGDADTFSTAMIDAGFIDDGGLSRSVHDWPEYGGKLLARKETNRNRMRETRAAYKPSTETHDSSDNNERATHVQRTDDARASNVQSQSREEKSTEEYRREENTTTPPNPQGGTLTAMTGGKKIPALELRFDAFWNAYPRKVGKQASFKVWTRLHPDPELTDVILAAIEQQKKGRAWIRDGGQYVPNPATWLGQGRWEDEIETAPAGSLSMMNGGAKLSVGDQFRLKHGVPLHDDESTPGMIDVTAKKVVNR